MNKYFFLFFILTLFSCRDDEHYQTSVNGKVIDIDSHQPISGATVYIVKVKNSNPNSVVHFIETTSNATGNFIATFTAEKDYRYYAYAKYNNYLFLNFVFLPFGQTNNVNVLLAKPGIMRIHVKNQNPFDNSDKLEIVNSDYYFQSHIFNGNSVDSTLYITHYGNMLNPVYWKVTKNDSTIIFDTTLNFISLDTVDFDLFY